ncbi:hypothetical protein DSLPV1_156 [Dishui lake phycodnavirus 1]|uniref:hypothetical protein n=1 Tax=Dishui lake phycodnavirus 1 TaxID=2079134 RepID=UPI000CD67B66|nr:hypothetical protein C5Y57_gp156 [Dishui lake phycodnavirus 1]AUT19127.1 hypothetical protein DSLPV1_156 [Dishui lake phycodnavirus 1]
MYPEHISLGGLSKYFRSTGAKDHASFWIEGASNIVDNLLECLSLTDYKPTMRHIREFTSEREEEIRSLFEKHGSDKFIHKYYKFYASALENKSDIDMLEFGLGTKNPQIASTMYYYKQDANFESTPGSSLRAFRDFVEGSRVFGADIDRDILFEEDRIKTTFVDQLQRSTVDAIFPGQEFDFVVVDGLHQVTADVNSVLSIFPRVRPGGTIVVEDVCILGNWHIIDHMLREVADTFFVEDDNTDTHLYVIQKK